MTNIQKFNEHATEVYNLNKKQAPFVAMEYGINYCDGDGTVDFFSKRPTLKQINQAINFALVGGHTNLCIDIIGRVAYTMEEVKDGAHERNEESCVYIIKDGVILDTWECEPSEEELYGLSA